jgi:ectoine hydroxylase-related dioxygenase (phytanoyl-CoA dioxygenase family)
MSFSHTFHDGKLYCMFVKVLIYLTDVAAEEDGPFCYLQGSHKANWPWFTDTEHGNGRPELTMANFPSLDWVPVQTGDAIVLNEALLHGTLPKSSPGERLLIAFSYAPAFVANWEEIDKNSSDITKLGHY